MKKTTNTTWSARFLSMLMVVLMCLNTVLPAFAVEDSDISKLIDKTANGLSKADQTDVTLTVPGDVEGFIDVVFILGGGMTANMETIESAINVFKPSMESGKATVRMGIISLEKGKEIVLDLNSDEAVLDPATYVDFVTEKFDSINDLPGGCTNLHSQMLEAQAMLEAETDANPENKYVFVLATGRTYWFDDANGEQATIVNKVNGTYYWGNYLWQSQRGRHSSLYMLPDRYNNSYEAFFADIEEWVAADEDKYVFTPHFDVNDYGAYAAWYANNNKDLRALGLAGSRYGLGIVNPKPTADNFITGTMAAIGSETHPSHALNYERAQYECVQVWKELVDAGYRCYSICSETAYYQNNSPYIANRGYTGSSTSMLGHSFMNYLAELAGQEEAPAVWEFEYDENGNNTWNEVLNENFFDPIREDLLYSCSVGSYVEDYIGYDENTGNYEFIQNPEYVTLTVGGETYTTTQIDARNGADFSLEFTAPEADEATFWLDYYYGDGKVTEKFIWTFGENVSFARKAALTYKLQLTEKREVPGSYIVPTNNSAILYPKDSKGNDGDPLIFPEPEVVYELIDIAGFKTWEDEENHDGLRPESITINLLANGEKVDSKVVTEADGWEWTFTGLDKYEDGVEIVYTITEDEIDGYTTSVDGYNVINTHEIEKVEVSGEKIWEDNDNQDGKRPESITIRLYADGAEIDSVTVSEADGWAWTFTDLDKYEAGVEIEYTITEDEVAEYTTNVDGYIVTNTHAPEKVVVSGEKIWDDNNNQDGKRPASITIRLYADGTEIDSNVVTAADGWAWTFANLDKYEAGVEIVYTITEDEVAEYTTNVDGYNVTNTHAPEKVEVSGAKTWEDNDNQDGKRPESITINLLANGEKVDSKVVTAADGWAWTFANLDKYEAGAEIQYTITEDAVAEYTTKVDGYNVTNTHAPEKVEVSGTKTWDDNDNQDGKRPASITIRLYADGAEIDSKVVTEADGWAWTFANLDKYVAGAEIKYTITEDEVDEYTATINGYDVTNSYTPTTVDIVGTKTWDDNNNQDGKRPASITIRLYADGAEIDSKVVTETDGWAWAFNDLDKYVDGVEIEYTITEDAVAEYTTKVDGYNVINTHEIEKVEVSGEKTWEDNNNQDGKRPASITINLLANGEKVDSKVVTEADGWSWTFANLDKYEAGVEIQYTITEDAVAEYTTKVDGYNVTNTHAPEKVEVSGTKTWEDNDNQDGKRPASITINLLANGEKVDSKVVTAADGWAWTFANLDKYEAGVEIEYTITEDAVAGYTTKVDGYNVINTHAPETIDLAVIKAWDDANNQDGIRPSEVKVILLANGKSTGKSIVLSADNGWAGSFTSLEKYENGQEILYIVAEATVKDYTPVIVGTVAAGYTITNKHTPEKVEVSGEKTWVDNNDQDGKRPTSITINLLANGEKVDSKVVTEADGWAWTFANLDKYEAGVEITYTITEDAVAEYTTKVDGYNVINTHEIEKVEVSGTKTWEDNDNQDGKRPASITINLLANGEKVDSKVVTEADGWAWTFANLDKYEAGAEITYTITEDAVAEYTTKVDGYNVINTHEIEKVEVSGTKTWEDNNNQDGKRPASITINLLANGEKVDSKVVTEADGWAWTFANLDKYEAGVEIVYTITEDAVAEYTTEINGNDVINTHEIEKVEVSGAKTWEDNNNQDGKRPASITINLLANGEKVDSKVVTAADGWAWTFANLDKYEAGAEITYTITEDEVAEYTTTINGYNVTNTHAPGKVNVNGTKIWMDNNNQDGKRPASITINLLANGEKVDSKVVTEADGWAWTFANLDKYEAGVEIVYTITEDAVAEYTTKVDGYNVINTHEIEKVEVSGTKTWEDNNNQDGKRPASITINLLANGEKVDSKVVTEADGWAWTFANLDKYEAGVEIVYTITEDAVAEYTTEINGNNVINTHEIEKVEVSGAKTWDDNNNQDGKRPASITINLLANGEKVDSKVVTEADGWAWTFANLDKYEAGVEIVYTITEDAVAEYTTKVDGYNVINTHEVEKVEVPGEKIWIDNDYEEGTRPSKITIRLYADGVEVDSKAVTAADAWRWTFTNLDKYNNGEEIVYTISEDAVHGYTTEIDGYNVINTYETEEPETEEPETEEPETEEPETEEPETEEPETEEPETEAPETEVPETEVPETEAPETEEQRAVPVMKVWEDGDDEAGMRPEFVTIQLYANGAYTGKTVTLNGGNGWTAEFEELPVYDETGAEIAYTVMEVEVESYVAEITGNAEVGFVITNLYTEEIIEDPVPLAPQGPQAPQTGDNTWILMLTTILSAGAVVAVVAIPKKKEEEEA